MCINSLQFQIAVHVPHHSLIYTPSRVRTQYNYMSSYICLYNKLSIFSLYIYILYISTIQHI
jgi:hypothetical protein